jgi:hypothetical protein
MKRSGVMYLAGFLIAVLCLLASSPVAAQTRIVPLPNKGGGYACQREVSKTIPVTSSVNWLLCIDSVQGFAIFTPSPTSQTETFVVKQQTDTDILGFSNSASGPFSPTISVTLNAGTNQSAPFYVLGKNLGQSVFDACSTSRCTINNETILVYGVESVSLEEIDSTFDTNPKAGGGLRIFPDKNSGDDPTDRRKVRVTAKLSINNLSGLMIPVLFKSFDVDDPSSDDAPVDPNGPAGDDNRGAPNAGQLSATQVFADANGVAQVDFTVTMQPGDNFRVAASCFQGYLDKVVVSGINLAEVTADGTQTLPSKHVQGTDMLTVWRRLHIEVDSMGPVTGNFVEGMVTKARVTHKGTTVLTLLDKLDDYLRFNPGRITLEDTRSFPVIDASANTVTVQGVVVNAANKHFMLVDDDDFNDNDGVNLRGDEGEDLTGPNTDWVVDSSDDPATNVFAPAYVRPVYDLSNPHPKVPFLLNSPEDATPGPEFDNVGTVHRADFWTAYLLGAYQGPIVEDGDGDSTTLWGVAQPGGPGLTVFLEPGRPIEESRYAAKAAFVNQKATTAHELGHWLGVDDCTSKNPDPEGGLMCEPPERTKGSLSAKSLDIIRHKVQ